MENINIKRTITDEFIFNTFINDWMGGDISNGKIWEPHILEFLNHNLNSNSTFIDVGSNYGWHSIHASKLCKEVYSFEPQKMMFDIQRQNIIENNINNIKCYNLGIGNQNESKHMTEVDYNNTSMNYGDLSVSNDDSNIGELIEIKTIDSFDFENVDVVKIDVQGYEKFVLFGMVETVKKHKPTIIIEIESHQLRKFNYTPNILYDFIRSIGYEIFLLDYHYPSDCVCIHNNNISEFREKNKSFILELVDSNNISECMENGVKERIFYSDEIKNNTKKYNLK